MRFDGDLVWYLLAFMGFGTVVAPVGLDLSMVLAPVRLGFAWLSACFPWCWYGGFCLFSWFVTAIACLLVAPFSLGFGRATGG